MSCIITFLVGNETPITLEVDESVLLGEVNFTSSNENTNINRLLLNIAYAAMKDKVNKRRTKFDELKDSIVKSLKSSLNSEVSKIEDFKQGNLPNATTDYIRNLYPTVVFPEDINFPIILVDSLSGASSYGIIPGMSNFFDGKDIYIVRNTKASIIRFANHLKVRSLVEGKDKVINNFENLQELEELSTKLETTKEKLILDYLEHPSKYNHMREVLSTGRTPKFILEEVSNLLNNVEGIPRYKTQILNEFCASIKISPEKIYVDMGLFLNYTLKTKFLSSITSIKKFMEIFNKNASEVNLEELKNDKAGEFEKLFIEKLLSNINEADPDTSGLDVFVETLLSIRGIDEPLFRYQVSGTTKVRNSIGILLENKFPSFSSVYGCTWESFKGCKAVNTIGSYTIYSSPSSLSGEVTYIVSRHLPGPKQEARQFLTEDEALNYARDLYNKDTLREGAIGNLKFVDDVSKNGRTFESPNKIPIGTFVKSLALSVNFDNLRNNELLLLDKNLHEFGAYILEISPKKALDILLLIDSAEKAAVFLSKINEPGFERNEDNFLKVALDIDSAGYKYYYIRKRIRLNNGNYRHYFLPVPNAEALIVNNPSINPRIPIISILDSVALVMNDKFGVNVLVMTLQEINDELEKEGGLFNGLEFDEGTKAFIYNGTIYINSTYASDKDLFHEYAHLFMGVLKARNKEWYIQTLDTMTKISPKTMKQIEYKMQTLGRSYYDAAEEVFADLYGQYLLSNLPANLETLFDKDIIKSAVHSVFDLADDKADIRDFLAYKKMHTLFLRFNSDIARAFSNNNNFLHNDILTLLRRKLNWIEAQLKLYKLLQEQGVKDEENEGLKEEC